MRCSACHARKGPFYMILVQKHQHWLCEACHFATYETVDLFEQRSSPESELTTS